MTDPCTPWLEIRAASPPPAPSLPTLAPTSGPGRRRFAPWLGASLLAVLGGLQGCSDRHPHADDAIYLTPAQSHDVFLASDNLGPDSDVIVLATVPKARYEHGAIVLTGGKDLYVVQPHAWRVYTGTALSTEEAQRVLSRAARLDSAVHDVGEAAGELRTYLDGRSSAAQAESDRMRLQDEAWKKDQEHQVQAMLADANRLQRSRDHEVNQITRQRDERIAGLYASSAAETQELTERMARAVVEISKRYADQEASATVAFHEQQEHQLAAEGLENDVAAAKGDAYRREVAEYHRKHHDEVDAAQAARLDELHARRDQELAQLRTDTARRIDETRRLTEEKVERVRQEADVQLAAVQTRQSNESAAASAGSTPAPSSHAALGGNQDSGAHGTLDAPPAAGTPAPPATAGTPAHPAAAPEPSAAGPVAHPGAADAR